MGRRYTEAQEAETGFGQDSRGDPDRGRDQDRGHGIAVDASGNVLVTGVPGTSGWVSGGWDTSLNNGAYGY